MKIFKNRQSAGQLLAKHLNKYKGQENTVVLGIPRGGVVVAAEIAKALKLPLDIIVTRKIGAPTQPELALGAVDADGEVVWDQNIVREFGEVGEFRELVEKEVAEIKRRQNTYRQGKKPLNLEDKTVILVDDGIATGSTTQAAISYLKKHKVNKIILAVPVASKDIKERFSHLVDQLVILETPEYFAAVGQFYHQFESVEDEEVIQLLSSWKINF